MAARRRGSRYAAKRRAREEAAAADGDQSGSAPDPMWAKGWVVRPIPAPAARKMYRCPGCDQEIVPGVAHLVVWPEDGDPEVERRHWHTPCWRARSRRGVKVHRSKNAPRYG